MPKKALTSLDVYKFLEELDVSKGAFVRNIKSRKNEFYLQLFSKKEFWLKFVPGSYLCVTDEKPQDTTDFPFTMKVKNLLKGKKVSIEMHEPDRIVEICSEGIRLIIELFSSGNIILTENGRITMALYPREYGNRVVREGENYSYPPGVARSFKMDGSDIMRLIKASDKESIVKTLALDFYLGGNYAEEIIFRSRTDKDKKPTEVTPEEMGRIADAYTEIIEGAPKPNVIEGAIFSVIDLTHVEGERKYFDSINQAIISFFAETAVESRREMKIKQDIVNTEKKIGSYNSILEFLNSNYTEISDMIKSARDSSISLEDRTKKLKESGWDLTGRIITSIARPEVAVDIINPLRSQMSDLYEKVKRMKKGLGRAEARPEPKKELKFREAEGWYTKFRWSRTRSGKLVVIGRDMNQNTVLVDKHCDNGDLVFHADIFGSPFGVVKINAGEELSDEEKKECASLICSYSSAWKAGAMALDVYYVKPEQVTKTPPSGESLKKGAFYIKGKRNYVKNAELGVYIAVESDGEAYSISVSAHEPDGKYLLIKPGDKSREEILKRIKKIIEQRLGFSPNRDKIDKLLPNGRFSIEKLKM